MVFWGFFSDGNTVEVKFLLLVRLNVVLGFGRSIWGKSSPEKIKVSSNMGKFDTSFNCSGYQFQYWFLFYQTFLNIMFSVRSEGNDRLIDREAGKPKREGTGRSYSSLRVFKAGLPQR